MTVKDTAAVSGTQDLQRTLQNRYAQLIAIDEAIGTGLLMGSGETIATTGPSVLFVYTIIGAVLFLFMRAMGELLLSDSHCTTLVGIAYDLIGLWAGFVTGWTYWICWVVTGVADMVTITGYVRLWWSTTPAWIPIVIMTALLFTLSAMTARAFGETELQFVFVKIIAILALVFVRIGMALMGIIDEAGTTAAVLNLWLHGGFFPKDVMGLLGGFQIVLPAFVGTELVGTTVAETTDLVKILPRAINPISIRIMLFYVAALVATVMVIPRDQVDPERSPLITMFSVTGLGIAATIINLVVLTSAASSANSGIYSASRMLFGLANRGDAPKVFPQLSKRHVPRNALLLFRVFLLSVTILMASDDSILAAFTLVTPMSATLFMGVQVVIVASYLIYPKKRPYLHEASTFKAPGGVASAWLVPGFVTTMVVVPGLFSDIRAGLVPSLVWIDVVTVVALVHRHRMLKRAKMGQLEGF